MGFLPASSRHRLSRNRYNRRSSAPKTVLSIVIQKSAPTIDGMWTRKLGDHYSRRQTSESAVSVTATVLNEVDDIDRLVTSLMEQTLSPAEVIIVDGGSTDGTWERLQAGRE